MSEKRLEEVKEIIKHNYPPVNYSLLRDALDWLIEQAERVEELEKRIKELEYASKYNGKLNEFLQKRKLPPNILGRHVVEVVMDYVEELEQQNKRYREALEFYADKDNYKLEHFDPNLDDYMSTVDYDEGQKARQTIGSEKIND